MVFPVVVTEHVLILLVTGSQNHQLHVVGAHLVHHALDQIQAFLVRQAGHNAHHKLLLIHRQSQLLLKSRLILHFFLAEIPRVVILGDKFIRLRVKLVVIDAVYNPPQAVGPGSHQAVQALAVKRSFDLLRIGIAHGGDGVRVHDASL